MYKLGRRYENQFLHVLKLAAGLVLSLLNTTNFLHRYDKWQSRDEAYSARKAVFCRYSPARADRVACYRPEAEEIMTGSVDHTDFSKLDEWRKLVKK